jgi:beta-galactosidase/beta-glucuronidase
LPTQPRPEYPRPNLRRRDWINLNGAWRFGFDEPNFDRTIIVPFAYQAPLSGIGRAELHDTVWYARRFVAPGADQLLLHFGAVDYGATVFINDVEVGRHEGGHVPFSLDITAAIRPGENDLVVRADDPATDRTIPRGKQGSGERPEGIFYTATTGIWQTVWLEPLPERRITSLRLMPDRAQGVLDFEVAASSPAAAIELSVSLAGRPVGGFTGELGRGRVALAEVTPWAPDSPACYAVTARLIEEGGAELDRVDSYFGLRSIETRDGHVFLNGQPYIQRLVLDQGYFPGGWYTAASDDDFRRDIELAKSFGFNGARKHQKVEDPRWLYWADRLGFLVWSEMPNFHQHTAQAEQRLLDEFSAAIERDRDHPCVVAWVPMNESFGFMRPLDQDQLAGLLVRLYRRAHQLDGTRPVVSNDGWEHALTDLCTLHNYGSPADLRHRYQTLAAALDGKARPRPPYLDGYRYRGEPVLVTEFGGVALEGSGGWNYGEVANAEGLVRTYAELIDGLMGGPVDGFCYTQLVDIEQERNGLLTFDRQPKVNPSRLRPHTLQPKRANSS